MKLPLLLSVPHSGLEIPTEVRELCLLSPSELQVDSDEDAAELYDLSGEARLVVKASIARCIVDVNRALDDRSEDGVLKQKTRRSQAPIYREALPPELAAQLLDRYYQPYHQRLTQAFDGARLGIDCHTMSHRHPGTAAQEGATRPRICLSDAEFTCPKHMLYSLMRCLEESFECVVSLNVPFRGGHIIRSHAAGLPWVQLEISREPYAPPAQKRARLLQALSRWCAE